jgi:hypothetical protein
MSASDRTDDPLREIAGGCRQPQAGATKLAQHAGIAQA